MQAKRQGRKHRHQADLWIGGAVDQSRSRHYNLPESFSPPATSKTGTKSQGAVVCFPA